MFHFVAQLTIKISFLYQNQKCFTSIIPPTVRINPTQLLAEILINRDAYNKGTFANPSNYPITYGILLKYDSKQGKADGVYDYLKKHINNSDWIDFGSKFNCEYIFLFDETTFVLYYQDWKTFLSSFNPTVY